MKSFVLIIASAMIFLLSCTTNNSETKDEIIANGKMPDMVADQAGIIHLVYGSGDSLLYTYSSDEATTFSRPVLISTLPKLMASAMRGPQIAVTSGGLSVTACNTLGDIFSFVKDASGNWIQTARVNDVDTIAKENLMALASDGQRVFSVWLDLREKHNKIYGASSSDGGRTWSKNQKIYESPDTTVCECCKPSVKIKDDHVFVMFRNWLHGARDLYLISSTDGGSHFGTASKIGSGSWNLDGCPMDGGGLVINESGKIETVWKRKGTIYYCEPGEEERELGEGKHCTIETIPGGNVIAWVDKNGVVALLPGGLKKNLGKGDLPVIAKINDKKLVCIWQNENEIHSATIPL